MIKKLTRHGNSMALIIDKSILRILNINEDTPLEITTDGKSLGILPIRDKKRQEKFKEALQKVNKKHKKALKTMA